MKNPYLKLVLKCFPLNILVFVCETMKLDVLAIIICIKTGIVYAMQWVLEMFVLKGLTQI